MYLYVSSVVPPCLVFHFIIIIFFFRTCFFAEVSPGLFTGSRSSLLRLSFVVPVILSVVCVSLARRVFTLGHLQFCGPVLAS